MTEALDQLEIISTIAFQGKTRKGLVFHCDKKHVAFSVGQTVMVREMCTGKEYRYSGHTNTVSCLAASKDGSYLASGQENFMGFKADVIIWNFHERTIYASHSVHQVKVEAVAFTCDSKYVVSLGGQDCGNVVIYDIDGYALLCGNSATPLSGGYANLLRTTNTRNDGFVSAGNNSLRIWKINFKSKRVTPTNASIGRIRRKIKCVDIDVTDKFLYCGTVSGDILKLHIIISEEGFEAKLLSCLMRIVKKEIIDIPFFSGGVTAIAVLKTGELLVGSGDGIVCRCTQVECPEKDLTNKPHKGKASTKKTQVKLEMKLKELE